MCLISVHQISDLVIICLIYHWLHFVVENYIPVLKTNIYLKTNQGRITVLMITLSVNKYLLHHTIILYGPYLINNRILN